MSPEAAAAYAEAQWRIKKCRRVGKQGTVLDLSRLGLTQLPPELGQMVDACETAILKRRGYPTEHERIIEEVMRRFDLLYDSADHGAQHRMLIPLMLPEPMPEFAWAKEGTLEFRFQYEVMPAGLLPAFMARMHQSLSDEVPTWRHGCVIVADGCKARVIADAEAKQVQISVQGAEAARRELLDRVRFTFGALHGAIAGLVVAELIPVPGRPDAPKLKYSYLRSLSWKGTEEIEVEGTALGETILVNVREALDGVRGRAQSERDEAERRGGDTYNISGDLIRGTKPMKDDHRIHIGGNVTNAQVGQTLTNCINHITQTHGAELADLFTKLNAQLAPVKDELKGKEIKVLDEQVVGQFEFQA